MRWEVIHEPVPGAKFQPGEYVSFGLWQYPASGLTVQEIQNSRVDLTIPYMVRHSGMVLDASRDIHDTMGGPTFYYTVQDPQTGKNYYFWEDELMWA